jgi:hypothetical protein
MVTRGLLLGCFHERVESGGQFTEGRLDHFYTAARGGMIKSVHRVSSRSHTGCATALVSTYSLEPQRAPVTTGRSSAPSES